jgi:acetyltransferase-like isoleucine patch superfamily enzyme
MPINSNIYNLKNDLWLFNYFRVSYDFLVGEGAMVTKNGPKKCLAVGVQALVKNNFPKN